MLASILRDFRSCWKELVLADLVYKVIAFVLLAPLIGITFRLFVAASGRSVLADTDVLYFFLGPVGWISLILVGGIFIGIVAIELAALLVILQSSRQKQTMGVADSLRFATAKALPHRHVSRSCLRGRR